MEDRRSKRAFLVSGADRVGERGRSSSAKLAAKRINVIAIDAVCAGSGRYGASSGSRPASTVKRRARSGAR